MTALDMLIPRKTDIGSVDVEKDFESDSTSKYSQAMRFLRSKESILTPNSEIKGSRIQQLKDKVQSQGVQGTVVDRYVEKQLAWSIARGDWDAVRSEALGKWIHSYQWWSLTNMTERRGARISCGASVCCFVLRSAERSQACMPCDFAYES